MADEQIIEDEFVHDEFVPDEPMTLDPVTVQVVRAWGPASDGSILAVVVSDLGFGDGPEEIEYLYRADDEYGPLVPELTRMLADGEITLLPWADRPVPTIQFLRRTKKEFRNDLIANGIMPSAVSVQILEIENEIERETALNAWDNSEYYDRNDPLIDQIGALFGLSPKDIDALWPSNGTTV